MKRPIAVLRSSGVTRNLIATSWSSVILPRRCDERHPAASDDAVDAVLAADDLACGRREERRARIAENGHCGDGRE
jgi:hypothetical protein